VAQNIPSVFVLRPTTRHVRGQFPVRHFVVSCICLTVCYRLAIMTSTITFRLDRQHRIKLRRQAKASGKTESEFIRELLDRELESQPLGDLLRHVRGKLSLDDQAQDPWRRDIQDRNWRP
jgi:hypothetical protein